MKVKSPESLKVMKAAILAFRVPLPRTPMDWAEAGMVLPPDSAEPGPYRSGRTPFLLPIAQAVINPEYNRIIIVCASQMAKTTFLFAVIGHRIDDDPVPTIYVCATQKLTKSISKDRFMKMVNNCPSLQEKLKKGKSQKIEEKFFSGTRVGFAWGSSANELKSHPAGLVVLDERDGMDDDVDGEGDPLELLDARTTTYPDKKVVVASSPTIEGASPIWSLWAEGTRFRWSWPCPECGKYFIPCLERLKWPGKATPNQAAKSAYLECPHCAFHIRDRHKKEMNARGVYVGPGQTITKTGKVRGGLDPNSTASFWISGLASPWRSYGEAAKKFLQAVNSKEAHKIKTVLNTVFGELFKIEGEAPDWEEVAELKQPYPFLHVPDGVLIVTCGVDVQKDRLVFSVRGWGEAMESWQIYSGELWGETDQDLVWENLEETLLATAFTMRNGTALPIHIMGIDAGYRPEMVYAFSKLHPGRVVPCKGWETRGAPVTASKIEINLKGKRLKGSIQLWHLDDGYFKGWVHGRIRRPPEASGGWHLSMDATDDFCKQMVSEELVTKPSGRMTWVRTGANHFLDCEKINVACAHILHVNTMRQQQTRPVRRVRHQGLAHA